MDLAHALRAFVRTVERGSISAAARDLTVSQPAVSKVLRNLETHVGARLLERSTRLVRPTAQGRMLYEASREALGMIDSALEGVRRDMGAVEGLIRVFAPSCLGEKHLHPIVMAFQERHPKVTVDLVLENRHVDIVPEDFDLAIKYGRPEGQELIIRRLGNVRRVLVAAPAFLQRFGPVKRPEQLAGIALITTPAVSPRNKLPVRHNGQSLDVPVQPVLRTNSAEVLVSTLLSGRAAGPVQYLLVADEIAEGKLIHILPDYEVRSTEAYIAYPSVRFMRPAVRAFTDFAVPALRAIDGLDNDAPIARSLQTQAMPQRHTAS